MKKIVPRVPVFEPEVVQAEADRNYRGDDEKVATTSVKKLVVLGIEIDSRYQKAHELEVMAQAVEGLPPHLRSRIKTVFCDTKACACYRIEVTTAFKPLMTEIGRAFEAVILRIDQGHNGIYVEPVEWLRSDTWVCLNPNWTDDGPD